MIMKKILMTAILCCTITVSAQEDGEHQSSAQTDRNRTYRITLGNVQYAHHDEKMSAGDAVGKILEIHFSRFKNTKSCETLGVFQINC